MIDALFNFLGCFFDDPRHWSRFWRRVYIFTWPVAFPLRIAVLVVTWIVAEFGLIGYEVWQWMRRMWK